MLAMQTRWPWPWLCRGIDCAVVWLSRVRCRAAITHVIGVVVVVVDKVVVGVAQVCLPLAFTVAVIVVMPLSCSGAWVVDIGVSLVVV